MSVIVLILPSFTLDQLVSFDDFVSVDDDSELHLVGVITVISGCVSGKSGKLDILLRNVNYSIGPSARIAPTGML